MTNYTKPLAEQLDKSLQACVDETNKRLLVERSNHSKGMQCLALWDQHAPALEEALRKLGLCIDTLNIRSTPTLDFTAVPLAGSGKFHFIAFAGYTARGAGLNNTRLRNKAHTIKTVLEEACAYSFEFNINPYSLEAARKGYDWRNAVLGTAMMQAQ